MFLFGYLNLEQLYQLMPDYSSEFGYENLGQI